MDSVTICNMALMAAGIPAIVSLEEENNNAKMCKSFYPAMRDRVLRDHTWSFAVAYAPLQQLAEKSPDPEYAAVCQMPNDAIRAVRMLDHSNFCRIGNKILVQSNNPTLVYVRRVEDPNLFDSAFIEALQYLLASEFCFSSRQDMQAAQFFRQEYERKLAIARSIDSQENLHANQPAGTFSTFAAARAGAMPARRTGKVVFVQGNAGKQV